MTEHQLISIRTSMTVKSFFTQRLTFRIE